MVSQRSKQTSRRLKGQHVILCIASLLSHVIAGPPNPPSIILLPLSFVVAPFSCPLSPLSWLRKPPSFWFSSGLTPTHTTQEQDGGRVVAAGVLVKVGGYVGGG